MGFPLISQRLHTPSGEQDAESPRYHSLYSQKGKRERETERDGGLGGVGSGWSDSQGHLNKHKPDAEHVEHVCGHETGVCG